MSKLPTFPAAIWALALAGTLLLCGLILLLGWVEGLFHRPVFWFAWGFIGFFPLSQVMGGQVGIWMVDYLSDC